jgi:hypothetical protein
MILECKKLKEKIYEFKGITGNIILGIASAVTLS